MTRTPMARKSPCGLDWRTHTQLLRRPWWRRGGGCDLTRAAKTAHNCHIGSGIWCIILTFGRCEGREKNDARRAAALRSAVEVGVPEDLPGKDHVGGFHLHPPAPPRRGALPPVPRAG